ncbi:MAG: hypothetical protein R3E48_08480 [Burkholderiaceae bacterium]
MRDEITSAVIDGCSASTASTSSSVRSRSCETMAPNSSWARRATLGGSGQAQRTVGVMMGPVGGGMGSGSEDISRTKLEDLWFDAPLSPRYRTPATRDGVAHHLLDHFDRERISSLVKVPEHFAKLSPGPVRIESPAARAETQPIASNAPPRFQQHDWVHGTAAISQEAPDRTSRSGSPATTCKSMGS